MPETSILAAVCVCLFVVLVVKWFLQKDRTPPGPVGLPILGYIPFLSEFPYLDFEKLAKKYGNIFSLYLGTKYVVVLNDYESTKEAFNNDAFMGRPPLFPYDFNKETDDTFAFKGLPWKEQRRVSLYVLKNLGLGKSKMEELMQQEISCMLEQVKKHVEEPFVFRDILTPSMSNNMSVLMFGKRYSYDDPVRKMMTAAVEATAKAAKQVSVEIFFPMIKSTMKVLGVKKVAKASKILKELKAYTQTEIDQHKKTLNHNDVRDYIDGYLIEIEKRKEDPSFSEPVLQDITLSFFIAGSETVRLTVEWSIILAATHPNAQRRIQKEIDEVVGPNRPPSWADSKMMPFTQAFIMEVMRFRPLIPLNLLRYTLTDVELNGYFIPKYSYVVNNLWAIHKNKNYWGEDAEKFRPERFLSPDGKDVKKVEHFIPFSVGKRACPGEPMAKSELFLYFTSILQHFNVQMPEGHVEKFEGTLGAGLQPKTDTFVFTNRNIH